MGASEHRVTRSSASRLEIAFSGDLTERDVAAAEAEARALLSAAKAGTVALVVDLRGLRGANPVARDALVALQLAVGGKLGQSAYVADSAAGRGLSLWIRHTLQDQVVKSFSTHEDAVAWLCAEAGPTTGVRPVARARKPTNPGGRRAAG
jgi:phage-related tail protein